MSAGALVSVMVVLASNGGSSTVAPNLGLILWTVLLVLLVLVVLAAVVLLVRRALRGRRHEG